MRRVGCEATMPQTVPEPKLTARVAPEPRAWAEGVMARMTSITTVTVSATVAEKGSFVI
jgi:hypothetical protein